MNAEIYLFINLYVTGTAHTYDTVLNNNIELPIMRCIPLVMFYNAHVGRRHSTDAGDSAWLC